MSVIIVQGDCGGDDDLPLWLAILIYGVCAVAAVVMVGIMVWDGWQWWRRHQEARGGRSRGTTRPGNGTDSGQTDR